MCSVFFGVNLHADMTEPQTDDQDHGKNAEFFSF